MRKKSTLTIVERAQVLVPKILDRAVKQASGGTSWSESSVGSGFIITPDKVHSCQL